VEVEVINHVTNVENNIKLWTYIIISHSLTPSFIHSQAHKYINKKCRTTRTHMQNLRPFFMGQWRRAVVYPAPTFQVDSRWNGSVPQITPWIPHITPWIPHITPWIPHTPTMDSMTFYMESITFHMDSTSFPHGFHIIPHGIHNFPHGFHIIPLWIPHYSTWIPHHSTWNP